MEDDFLQATFNELSNEAVDLYLGDFVQTIDYDPEDGNFPLKFYRDYVSANKPVKIKHATSHWPANQLWTNDYLQDRLGKEQISVAITPNGYADAITDGVFMLPDERNMTFEEFLKKLNQKEAHIPNTDAVYYIQKQNSNMTSEFSTLMQDVDKDIPWATQAFGLAPDAVNFWMGDQRAITSMHKDHYENIYCVVRGTKTFTLIPPTDQAFVPYVDVDVYKYVMESSGTFGKVRDDSEKIPWIAVDPLSPELECYPQFARAHQYTVTVGEGEMLYLPSLWYHHVQQTHGCIAVNYWYDMQYDIKFNYYQFISSIINCQKKS